MTDDGGGIESPETMLSFGRSGWDGHDDEHPAGMGLYSLSRRGADISSRTRSTATAWRAVFEPKHFRGDETAVVESLDPSGPTGTTVTFPITENDDCPETAALTRARYLPLRVTISGTSVPQEPFIAPSRLAGVVEEPDLVFGVCRREPWIDGPTEHDLTINFHGQVVTDDVRTPVVQGLDSWWTATVEVRRCAGAGAGAAGTGEDHPQRLPEAARRAYGARDLPSDRAAAHAAEPHLRARPTGEGAGVRR